MFRYRILFIIVTILFGLDASAQTVTLDFGGDGDGEFSSRFLSLIAAVTVLGLAPSLLVAVTSFTRIIVVLSILRTAMGLQQSPPNPVLIGLALFLTFFIMRVPFEQAYNEGLKPYSENQITMEEAYEKTSKPIQGFMLEHTRDRDLELFMSISADTDPNNPRNITIKDEEQEVGELDIDAINAEIDTPLEVIEEKKTEPGFAEITPAFMISELRRAFEIGFLLYLPFLIIDMVISATLMAMGMMMLPPVLISLPFKLIFFVLVDGWHMLAGSLLRSYGV